MLNNLLIVMLEKIEAGSKGMCCIDIEMILRCNGEVNIRDIG